MKITISTNTKKPVVGVPLEQIPAGHLFRGIQSNSIGFVSSEYSSTKRDYTWLKYCDDKFCGFHIDLELANELGLLVEDLGPVEIQFS